MLAVIRRFLVKLCDPHASINLDIQNPSPVPPGEAAVDSGLVQIPLSPENVPLPNETEPWGDDEEQEPEVSTSPENIPLSNETELFKDDQDTTDTTCSSEENVSLTPKEPSPLLQLPPELLARIFATICHADSDKFLSDKNKHKRTTFFVLGKICKHWRDIVWGTPHIWSHISLSLSASRYTQQVSLLEECLQRSGACLLTMNLTFDNEEDWSQRMPEVLIGLLVQSAKRWRSINFIIPEGWYGLLDQIKNDLQFLISVSTQPLWSDCGLSPSRRKRLTLFERTPLLKELHLNGYYVTDVDIPWSQLARFTLQHVYLDECFYTLPRTPHLTYCRIFTILINDVGREVLETDIMLYFLEHLIINSADAEDMARLLHFMQAPSLETLEITAPQSAVDLNAYAGLIGQMGCTRLRVLKFVDFKFLGSAELEFLAFLDGFPGLEEVKIELSREETETMWDFVVALLGEQEKGKDKDKSEGDGSHDPSKVHHLKPLYRAPKLERFSLKAHLPPEPDIDHRLADALERRWRLPVEDPADCPFVQLRSFELTNISARNDEDEYKAHLATFQEMADRLRGEGMHVHVKLDSTSASTSP